MRAMRLIKLVELDKAGLEMLAHVSLAAAREHGPEWLPDLAAARETVTEALAPERVALVALDPQGRPAGWVAAGHDWGRVWELHPLLVAIDQRRHGYGRGLVRAIERVAVEAGALTMVLGTSDTTGTTSLANVDLYADTLGQLARIEPRDHAVAFWQRVGYQIVGVVPDAEGPGMPSITMARRL
jgi:aminoglycoside 6'-N-acetyltransferase I